MDSKIQCWADVETALAELARLERQLEEIEACEREAKARVEAEAETRRAMPAAAREGLAAELERFCRAQRPGRGNLTSGQGVKSRRLVLGRVGYRQSHAVVIRSEAAALRSQAALREGRRFLRVSTAINREALRAFLLQTACGSAKGRRSSARARLLRRLRQSGVRLARRDYWFYELNQGALGTWG